MENLLISACLLGVQCRYDGGSKPVMPTVALMEQYHLIPICPEQLTPEDLAYMARYASAAASLSTEKSGAIPSIPAKEAVLQKMQEAY